MTSKWSSYWDGVDRAPLRWTLAVVAAVEMATLVAVTSEQAGDSMYEVPAGALALLSDVSGAAWIVYLVFMVGMLGVARDRWPTRSWVVSMVMGAILLQWQAAVFGSASRNSYIPGAAVLGWVAGQAWLGEVRRARGEPAPTRAERERVGEAGVLGILAAVYVGSIFSKLSQAGYSWIDGQQVRALILWQDPLFETAWTDRLRYAIVENRWLARTVNIGAFITEIGAVLLLARPSLRMLWAVAILGMHVAIILTCKLMYFEPMILLVVFAFPWGALGARSHGAGEEPVKMEYSLREAFPRRVLIALVAFLVLAAVLAPFGWRPPPS